METGSILTLGQTDKLTDTAKGTLSKALKSVQGVLTSDTAITYEILVI